MVKLSSSITTRISNFLLLASFSLTWADYFPKHDKSSSEHINTLKLQIKFLFQIILFTFKWLLITTKYDLAFLKQNKKFFCVLFSFIFISYYVSYKYLKKKS